MYKPPEFTRTLQIVLATLAQVPDGGEGLISCSRDLLLILTDSADVNYITRSEVTSALSNAPISLYGSVTCSVDSADMTTLPRAFSL